MDFQALRHTLISDLAAGGVHPRTAQALARHSTITLTMDRYTHRYSGDEAAALATLPDLSAPAAEEVAREGTNDAAVAEDTSNLMSTSSPTCSSAKRRILGASGRNEEVLSACPSAGTRLPENK